MYDSVRETRSPTEFQTFEAISPPTPELYHGNFEHDKMHASCSPTKQKGVSRSGRWAAPTRPCAEPIG